MGITVRLDQVRHTLRGGIGASWHAIADGPRQGAGSAWGGHPPADDDRRWNQLYRHADWLNLNFVRVEFEQRMYQPQRDTFTFDTPEMRVLERILDYCQGRGVHVLLQQMWGNVDWNSYPGVDALHSAPLDLEAFAEGLAALVEHLRRRYDCLRWLCINNEPGCSFSWWQGHGLQPLSITPGLKAVRAALDRRGLDLPLVGPDYTGLGWAVKDIDFDAHIGAYDLHTYLDHYRLMPPGQSEPEQNLRAWVEHANRHGKPLFLTEFGSMHFGWYGNHPGPGSYPASLKNAETILRGLHVGVEAFNRWSYTNRGDLDGQWQLVDTWDVGRDALLTDFVPHPNAYWMFGLISRFMDHGSAVLATRVDDVISGWQQYVLAESLRSPAGDVTVYVLNYTEQPYRARIELAGLDRPLTLHRYRMTPADRDQPTVRLDPQGPFHVSPGAATFEDDLPGLTLATYSTRLLAHDQPAQGPRPA